MDSTETKVNNGLTFVDIIIGIALLVAIMSSSSKMHAIDERLTTLEHNFAVHGHTDVGIVTYSDDQGE